MNDYLFFAIVFCAIVFGTLIIVALISYLIYRYHEDSYSYRLASKAYNKKVKQKSRSKLSK
jgi:hypothetical protein